MGINVRKWPIELHLKDDFRLQSRTIFYCAAEQSSRKTRKSFRCMNRMNMVLFLHTDDAGLKIYSTKGGIDGENFTF